MASELTLGTLNRARYAGLDFDTHNDDLLARLQVKFASDFNDFALASLGIMLLDLVAYGLDTLSFYLDRRATDTYLTTARTRSSVARGSRQLGYKMGGAVASAVDMNFVVEEVYSFDVIVPARFQLQGPDGLIFEVAEETTIPPASQGLTNTTVIPSYEGETVTESFVSDGTSAQVFELRRVPENKYVVEGTVIVLVDGAQWDAVDLLEYGATDQFEVGFNDEPSTVRFGDSLAGNIPAANATIDVTYVASRGKAGQVTENTITEEISPLIVAFTEISLAITNPQGSVGGDDRETLASAQAFAPKVWRANDAAVTAGDYDALSGSYADPLFGRVAVSKAVSSRSAATDLTVQNYLIDIQVAVAAVNSALTTAVAAAVAALDLLDAEVTTITNEITSIASHTTTIETEANSIIDDARTIKNKAGEVAVDAGDIQGFVVSGKLEVDNITTHATTSQLTVADKNLIKAWFDLITTEAGQISTAAGTNIPNSADDIITSANDILVETGDIGVDLVTAGTDLNDIANALVIISTQSAAVRSQVANIDTANDGLESAVDDATEGINTHFDEILAADCKANLVTVPILTRDSGGFYAAPSSGLVASLQTFLDGRKEVTQTVSVTSGENFLVPAVIQARIGVVKNYSEGVVKTAVQAVIEGVLRDRAFGRSLYESDLDDVVLEVEGVSFENIRILGHLDTDGSTVLTTFLDTDSNLIITDSYVITRGTITITTEIAPDTSA